MSIPDQLKTLLKNAQAKPRLAKGSFRLTGSSYAFLSGVTGVGVSVPPETVQVDGNDLTCLFHTILDDGRHAGLFTPDAEAHEIQVLPMVRELEAGADDADFIATWIEVDLDSAEAEFLATVTERIAAIDDQDRYFQNRVIRSDSAPRIIIAHFSDSEFDYRAELLEWQFLDILAQGTNREIDATCYARRRGTRGAYLLTSVRTLPVAHKVLSWAIRDLIREHHGLTSQREVLDRFLDFKLPELPTDWVLGQEFDENEPRPQGEAAEKLAPVFFSQTFATPVGAYKHIVTMDHEGFLAMVRDGRKVAFKLGFSLVPCGDNTEELTPGAHKALQDRVNKGYDALYDATTDRSLTGLAIAEAFDHEKRIQEKRALR